MPKDALRRFIATVAVDVDLLDKYRDGTVLADIDEVEEVRALAFASPDGAQLSSRAAAQRRLGPDEDFFPNVGKFLLGKF